MKKFSAFLIISVLLLPFASAALPLSAAESDNSAKFPIEEGWVEINEPSDWDDIYSGGKFYLSTDFRFEDLPYYPSATPKNVTIDGNGHTLILTQGQPSLFETVEDLTMQNITLAGDLVHSDKSGLNSPIAKWSNNGKTVLTNVTSKVNYDVTTTDFTDQNASGVAINAKSGSVFTDVVYEGTITVRNGAKIVGVSGIVYYANDATFVRCINKGKIEILGSPFIGSSSKDCFYVGGIIGYADTKVSTYDCINYADITVNDLPYTTKENSERMKIE